MTKEADRFAFKIEGRDVVSLNADGELRYGYGVTNNELRTCINYLLQNHAASEAKIAALVEALEKMACTCANPDGSYPHDPSNAECNLSIAKAATAEGKK